MKRMTELNDRGMVAAETAAFPLRVASIPGTDTTSQVMHPDEPPISSQPCMRFDRSHRAFALRTRRGRLLKRMLDLLLAVPVVVLALPVLCVLVKMAHWLQSPGPLLYCQRRSGRDGTGFTILKFRTMDVPAPGKSDIEENPGARIFPIGTILRRSKLDEIPQFVNVLLGSMSVVGPRPHHFDDCEKFSTRVQDYSYRTIAKPGITGLAQYTEYRGDFEWNCVRSRVAKDLSYINDWSLWLDIQLIFQTAGIVLHRVLSGVVRRLGLARQTSRTEREMTLPAVEDSVISVEAAASLEHQPASEPNRRAA